MKKNVLLISILLSSFIVKSQNVVIPDSIFKSLLVGNTSVNTNGDSEIQLSEAEAFRTTLYVGSKNIEDLTGIEAFTNLTGLSCYGNKLTSLDVSKNTKLVTLRCYINQLDTIDVSHNLALESLVCHRNSIKNIDVSKNTKLKELTISSLNITSLDLSNNPDLEELDCSFTKLTSLNIPFPDKLKMLDFSGLDSLSEMDLSQFSNLTELGCTSLELDNLDISVLPNLQVLNCGYNYLTTLDLSQHPNMVRLNCANNELTKLDVSNLKKLSTLYADQNKLATLDLSKNPLILYMRCGDNELTELNLANGNNENIRSIHADDCPQLTCIQVDRKSYADSNWISRIDTTISSFSEDCGFTNSIHPIQTQFTFYPNPASSMIYADVFFNGEIEVVNLLGKTLISKNSTSSSLDISGLPTGTYYIRVKSNAGLSYAKFQKH